jgi:hypothetical protein
MPAGDGTGPMGMGPMTGRGAGYCAGFGAPGYMNPTPGGALGGGFRRGGGGRGRRNWYYATGLPGWMRAQMGLPAFGMRPAYYRGAAFAPYAAPRPEDELNALRGQAEYLEDTLEGIKSRIAELEAAQKKAK